jgi:hypothetical protein
MLVKNEKAGEKAEKSLRFCHDLDDSSEAIDKIM